MKLKHLSASTAILLFLSLTSAVPAVARSATAESPRDTTGDSREDGIYPKSILLWTNAIQISHFFAHALNAKDPQVVRTSLILLGRLGDEATSSLITPRLEQSDTSVRIAAAFALGQMNADNEQPALVKALQGQLAKEKDPQVRAEIWLALGRLAPADLLASVTTQLATEADTTVRGSMFQALAIAAVFHPARMQKAEAIPVAGFLDLLGIENAEYASAGIFLSRVAEIGTQLSQTHLLELSAKQLPLENRLALLKLIRLAIKAKPAAENDQSEAQFAIQRKLLAFVIAQSELPELRLQIEAGRTLISFWQMPQAKVQLGKLQGSAQPLLSSETLFALANSDIEDEFLLKLFKQHLKNERSEMQLAAINGLVNRQSKSEMSWILSLIHQSTAFNRIRLIALLKDKASHGEHANEFDQFIQFMTQDKEKAVAEYAKSRLRPVKTANEPSAESPDFDEVQKVIGKRILLTTSAGEIELKLLADAPYTARHFAHLVEQHFFDNSYFHRVIGNFVAQGGDPIGDGEGSSGQTIREEISLLPHTPVSVGVATAGKDTGSSQFFINTARNTHLDRNYTIFAEVVSDLEILDNIVLGTKILKAEVKR